eukprot:GHVU01012583.1.p2 GENE.GHVU01012583.1~~GHVU01012583.1.p2  ORF type:complete len:101 (+),score=4.20 GHVU01012583.1:75-377(+)
MTHDCGRYSRRIFVLLCVCERLSTINLYVQRADSSSLPSLAACLLRCLFHCSFVRVIVCVHFIVHTLRLPPTPAGVHGHTGNETCVCVCACVRGGLYYGQ